MRRQDRRTRRKRTRRWAPGLIWIGLLAVGCASAGKPEIPSLAASPAVAGKYGPKKLFASRCATCHSLELPRSQRLGRADWEWVVGDMVNKFGATWITPVEQKVIIEYLSANYGRRRPREP